MKQTETQLEARRIARLIVNKGTITAAAMLAREIVDMRKTLRVCFSEPRDAEKPEMVN